MTEKSSNRGRPRAFDRTAALEAAMMVFWQKGFTATSMNDLCDAMEIGSPSLYAAFGSKKDLYAEAIRHYAGKGVPQICEAMNDAPTAKLGIEAYLRMLARLLSCPGRPSGCMVVLSSVASEGVTDLAAMILKERKKALELIEARLQRGIREGDVPAGTNVKALARFFVTLQQGMSIQARDGATPKELDAVASTAMQAWPGR